MTPPIAILGAGPSGLTLACLLEMANIDYIVFERDTEASPIASYSGSLDIHPEDGQVALQEAGVFQEFKKIARYDAPTIMADSQGNILFNLSNEGGGTDRPEIDRKDLRTLLLNSVPAEKIRFDSRVQRVEKDGEGSMSVHLADGSSETGFRLVVGADGGWSKARSLLTSAKPQYTGLAYLTTIIKAGNVAYDTAKSLAGRGNYNAISSGKMLVVMRLDDGSYWIATGLHLPETWNADHDIFANPPALRQWLIKERYSDWTQAQRDMIEHSEGNFRFWPLYATPTEALEWQNVPGVTVIGDAAHVCPPSGDGANVALFDSLQLVRQIKKHGMANLYQAVEEYEKDMFVRAQQLVTESLAVNEKIFAADSPKGFVEMFQQMMAQGDGSS